jgi:hypothetical protein
MALLGKQHMRIISACILRVVEFDTYESFESYLRKLTVPYEVDSVKESNGRLIITIRTQYNNSPMKGGD